jgi:hypothetical protein
MKETFGDNLQRAILKTTCWAWSTEYYKILTHFDTVYFPDILSILEQDVYYILGYIWFIAFALTIIYKRNWLYLR